MINIGSFSTGRLSAVMSERLLQKLGAKDVELVFMDTLIEDDDNYRFMSDLRARWRRIYGFSDFVILTEGRTPYQVSRAQHVIPNSLVAPCTNRLKIEPFREYLKSRYSGQDVTIHIGYDFSEMHRCEPTRAAYAKFGWAVDFPMLWKPIEFRNYADILAEWGIKQPRMYEMGFSHANCGGRCVKQGAGDWIKTLINFPERYTEAEAWEREMRTNPTNSDYTILKRTRNNQIENLTLEQLRREYEANTSGAVLFSQDFLCVHCGVMANDEASK